MKLTDMVVRNAAPRDSLYRLGDGEGMYLLVMPNGARYWRLDFTLHGKRRTAALGVYPKVSLKEARKRCEAARTKVAQQVDPVAKPVVTTFGSIADEWFERKVAPDGAPPTIGKTRWLMTYLEPLRDREISSLRPADMLQVLRRLEAQGKLESAARLRSVASRIFRYAVVTDRTERDICADLGGAIRPAKVEHRAAPLTPEKIGQLMRAISSYRGQHPATGVAMRLGALTFVRPYELRFAVWEEFDLANAMWRIPAVRMKMKRDHMVPLSRQSLAALAKLREFFAPKGLLFPSIRSSKRPISENTINAGLRHLGFSKAEATHHGFRRMASTILNEQGWNRDWVERQLAHVEGNAVRAAYNSAEWIQDRARMMQRWADLLDEFEGEEDLIG